MNVNLNALRHAAAMSQSPSHGGTYLNKAEYYELQFMQILRLNPLHMGEPT